VWAEDAGQTCWPHLASWQRLDSSVSCLGLREMGRMVGGLQRCPSWAASAAQLSHAPACRPAARVPGRGGWPPPRPPRQRAAGLAWPRLGECLLDAASSTRGHSVPKQEQTRTEKATSTRLKTSSQKIVTQITMNGNETRAMDSQLLNLTDSN